jgi:hypothetical protein
VKSGDVTYGHVTDVTYGHVTDVTYGHVTDVTSRLDDVLMFERQSLP